MPVFTVLNPATEEPVAEVEQTSAADADAAIARAVAAQAAWRKVAPGERAALLRAFADVVGAHIGELAELETVGSGHPAGQARWEAGNVRDVLRYYSAAPERLCGKQIPVPGGLDVTFHEPVGVVGVIVPWNFPMPILGWGVAPALAAGARQEKRVTMELGGKSANIVFADADLAKAAATAPVAAFDNAGQDCCARSRILVQREVYQRFLELLEPAVKAVTVGDPAREGTEMGPLISAEHRAKVASYVPAGAPVAFRGSAPEGPGYWFPPTVLAPVRLDDPAYTEEVFGPVVAVVPFEDEAQAVAMANDTPYGLSGSVWTGDVGRAIRVARAVETGNLSVNSHSSVRYWTPFGGFKQSGLGRELGSFTDAATTETKNVFIATDE